jgi:hypothetical protein
MNIDDLKLTAFALDELDEPERSTIGRAIADSPEAQRYVEETRELARALKEEFAGELERDKATSTSPNLIEIRDDPWFWAKARPLALAATIAIFAVVAVIVVGTYTKRSDSFRSVVVEYPPIEGQQNAAAAAGPEFSGPATLPNPFRVEAIRRIERIVIGELDADPHLESGELRLIEVINDAYRIQRLRERLATPTLSKKSLRSLAGHDYGLIFLDRTGAIVASARFYSLPDGEFVLQPLRHAQERDGRYSIDRGPIVPGDWQSNIDYGAYAIPFPDWNECVGYAPGA